MITYDLARAIHQKQLNAQGDGTVTVTLIGDEGLHRDTGQAQQAGDVLSVQPDGSFQARPKGTNGGYERAVVNGFTLAYAPLGASGHAFVIPVVATIPNV